MWLGAAKSVRLGLVGSTISVHFVAQMWLDGLQQASSHPHPTRSKTQHSEMPNKVKWSNSVASASNRERFHWVKGEDDLCCLVCKIAKFMSRQLPFPLAKFLSSSKPPCFSPCLPHPLLFQAIPLCIHHSAIQQPAWGSSPFSGILAEILYYSLSLAFRDFLFPLHSLLHGDYSSICPVKYFLHILA